MKRLITLCSLFLFAVSISATVSVIPLPQKCVEKKGTFTVNKETVIYLFVDNEEMRNAVAVWNDLMATAAGFQLEVMSTPQTSNVISCRLNNSLPSEEAYKLTVSSSAIRIEARAPKGVFYAFQTLRQLMPPAIESSAKVTEDVAWKVPCVAIEDAPAFSYRGLMLDVCRHFKTKEFVKRYIDLLAFHKLNAFHWHLTDDQGWRIEIKKYPKLTSVGGFRERTLVGHASHRPVQWKVERYGGFYTQEDIKEVVAYAQKRFVEVIPEIEMPGHATAALAAYPEFSCSGGPIEVEGRWGVFNDIFCTKEPTFGFMQDVLDEVIALFPSQYIHVGGDEAPKVRWKRCAACQNRIKQEGLPDEAHLQSYFINRIEKYLVSKGKKVIGWDEILEGNLSKSAMVMSWRGVKGGIQAAKNGHDVLMTPNTHCYFDRYQINPKTEPLAFGGLVTLDKVYSYDPIPKELSAEEGKHIKGVQGNMWSEYIPTAEYAEYMAFPRAAALAEVGWTPVTKKDFKSFFERLTTIMKHYDVLGVNYCKDYKPQAEPTF